MTRREPYAARIGDYLDEQSFTKWLAGEQSLTELDSPAPYHDKLERTIGIELWDLKPEVSYAGEYGGYYADIVARGYDGDQFVDVVIEAQLDSNKESALKHLGKLLHYGNLADADVLIWLTDAELDSRIYETVAWLAPQTTSLDLQVVETRVRTSAGNIDSLGFDRVVPDRTARPDDESALRQHQRRYWAQLIDESPRDVLDTNVQPSATAVHKQGRAISVKGVLPELVVNSSKNTSKVRIRFRQSAPPTLYQRLVDDRNNIEPNVTSTGTWTWDNPNSNPPHKLVIERDGLELNTMDDWTIHQRWQTTVLGRLRDVIESHHAD
jgi:hypothetical protein